MRYGGCPLEGGAGAAAIGDVAGFDVPQVAAARSQVEPAGVVAGFYGGNGNAGGGEVGAANVEGVAHGGGAGGPGELFVGGDAAVGGCEECGRLILAHYSYLIPPP